MDTDRIGTLNRDMIASARSLAMDIARERARMSSADGAAARLTRAYDRALAAGGFHPFEQEALDD